MPSAAVFALESMEVPMITRRNPSSAISVDLGHTRDDDMVDDHQKQREEEMNSFLNQPANDDGMNEDVVPAADHEFNENHAEISFDLHLAVAEQGIQPVRVEEEGREEQDFLVEIQSEKGRYMIVDDLLEPVDLDDSVILRPIPHHDDGLLFFDKVLQMRDEAVIMDSNEARDDDMEDEENAEEFLEEEEVEGLIGEREHEEEIIDEIGCGQAEEEDSDEDSDVDVEMISDDEDVETNRQRNLRTKSQPHDNTAGRRLFSCPIKNCPFSCKKFNELEKHMESHRNLQEFFCDVCKKSFPSKEEAMAHIQEREQRECCACGKKCSGPSHLVEHFCFHSGEKPFVCETCGQRFAKLHILKSHTLTHTGEKPFKCGHCDYCSVRKGDLMRHSRIHTGEKPYSCGRCEKRFSQKANLKNHELTHTGEKPFECDHCGRRFTQRSTLASHIRRHTGQNPFSCTKCNAKFNYSGNLKVHMKKKHHS